VELAAVGVFKAHYVQVIQLMRIALADGLRIRTSAIMQADDHSSWLMSPQKHLIKLLYTIRI
jgi:hypothetical protein